MTTQPGAVPLRPLAIGEILDLAMSLLRQHPAATLGLGAVLMAIQTALTVPVQWLTQGFTFSLLTPAADTAPSGLDPLLALLGITLSATLVGLISAACGGVVSGLAASVVGGAALGQPVAVRTVWAEVRPRLWALVGVSLLIGLATVIGSFFLFFGQFFVGAALVATVPAMVLERIGPLRAIRRSWDLVMRGASGYLRVVGIITLAWLVGLVLQFVFGGPFFLIGQALLTTSPQPSSGLILLSVFISGIGTMLGSILVAPFLGCLSALIYIDRRMRAEGLDIELGQRARRAVVTREAAA